MRDPLVLLDSCVPRTLKRELRGFRVQHVSEIGWQDLDDRPLLERADAAFDVFITTDQNLRYQQTLSRYSLAIIVLVAHSNRIADQRPLIQDLIDALDRAQPGDFESIP